MKKHEIRYNYCHLIAQTWFKILENIKESNPDIDYESQNCEIHETLSGVTLVGELVGIESIQQILNYPVQSLIFSSLIENSSAKESCLVPEKLISFCKRWKLNSIPIIKIGIFSTQEKLKAKMQDLYNKVTSGPIHEYEEGVIMVLVLRNSTNPQNDRVLS